MSTITWKNVDKLSSDDMGKSFLDSAQKSGITALDGLGGIVKSYQATADANQAQLKENATNEFMRQLLSAKNSQELSGMAPTLNEMLASRGAGINQEAAMKALDSRTGVMQARDMATNTFNAAQRVQQEMPATEALKVAIASNNPIEAARIRAANPNLGYSADSYTAERTLTDGIAATEMTRRTGEQTLKNRVQEVAASEQAVLASQQAILASQQSVISDKAKTANDATQLDINKQAATDARMGRLQETLTKAAARVADAEKQSITHPDGAAAVYAGLAIVKDEDTKKELVNMAADAMKDPKNAGMTTSTLINTLLAQKDRQTFLGKWVGTSVHRNSAFVSDLDEARKLDAGSAVTRTAMQAVAEEQVGTAREALKNALYPNGAPSSVEQAKPAGAAAPVPAVSEEEKRKVVTQALSYKEPDYIPPADSPAGRAFQKRLNLVNSQQVKNDGEKGKAVSAAAVALDTSDPVKRLQKLDEVQQSSGFSLLPVSTQRAIFSALNGQELKKK